VNAILDPWFVTGFVEGDGAFTYSTTWSGAQPLFSIRQRCDYGDTIRKIAEFFGIGKVYICKSRLKTRTNVYYVVRRKRDLPKIIEHFDHYPMQGIKKRKVFEVWRQMVFLKSNTNRPKQDGTKWKIIELAKILSTLNMKPRGLGSVKA
jgi:hypothetical protein